MNILLSLAVSVLLSASAAPTNPVIVQFIEESKAEIAKAGAAAQGADVLYEESFLGPAIVMVQPLPVTKDQLSQLPTSEIKKSLIQEMKSDASSKEFLEVLGEEKINFILRFVTADGGNMDVICTSADFK